MGRQGGRRGGREGGGGQGVTPCGHAGLDDVEGVRDDCGGGHCGDKLCEDPVLIVPGKEERHVEESLRYRSPGSLRREGDRAMRGA